MLYGLLFASFFRCLVSRYVLSSLFLFFFWGGSFVVISRCSKFFSVGIRNNNAITVSWAYATFIWRWLSFCPSPLWQNGELVIRLEMSISTARIEHFSQTDLLILKHQWLTDHMSISSNQKPCYQNGFRFIKRRSNQKIRWFFLVFNGSGINLDAYTMFQW